MSFTFSADSDWTAGSSATTPRPLPLKQRTSSQDARKDFNSHTLLSLLRLLKPREFFITVDNFSIWRRHMAWAMEGEGSDLRGYICQRYASSMVFMSLLLGAVLNVLFNSDFLATEIREDMRNGKFGTIKFWAGFSMLLSVVLTILSIISTFTAWGMVNAISDTNAHCVLRSSIGQYVAELPGRFIVASVYCFLIWILLLCIIMLPAGFWSYLMVIVTLLLFMHVVVVFSAFGRIIMHSGAMGSQRIFETNFEHGLLPHGLHANLLAKATRQLESKTSIMRQYRYPAKPLDCAVSMSSLPGLEIWNDACSPAAATTAKQSSRPADEESAVPPPPPPPQEANSKIARPSHRHLRTSSSVRFADNLLNSSTPVIVDSPLSRDHTSSSNRNLMDATARPPRPNPRDASATQAPSRPHNLAVPSSSVDSSEDKMSATIDAWIDGGRSETEQSADDGVQANNRPRTASGDGKIHSILLPSSYSDKTTIADGQRAGATSIKERDDRAQQSDRSANSPADTSESDLDSHSQSRKYFGEKQSSKRGKGFNSDTLDDGGGDKQETQPFWARSRDLASSGKNGDSKKTISDTQRAAIAATDAVARLMSRTSKSDRKPPSNGPTQMRHSLEENETIAGSDARSREKDKRHNNFEAHNVDSFEDMGSDFVGGGRSRESHPLLRDNNGKDYSAMRSGRHKRGNEDRANR